MRPPEYFERIQCAASMLWDKLENDEQLAAPWWQLFRQVQSPRHVVSELLQNADDARATNARVKINNGKFIFSHNGEDFNEEQFTSLCRFGFSNKRTLHTIGFRGVGFKSTFSLGNEVHLVTPTLSVAFREQRFTEPVWMESSGTVNGHTEVRVAIKSQQVQQEMVKNLKEWRKSPASLLFFNNIRRLRFDEGEIRWVSQGSGPVEWSEWMSASNTPNDRYLIIRSLEAEFPEDALREIKDERMTRDEDVTFPPCRVEIVLGMEGGLFAVLPTGVTTQLPFACNAPFIQDPSRMNIKDPALSHTNMWLLQRAGKLAADTILDWLGRKSLSIEERCSGYGLLPDVDHGDRTTLEGRCGAIVEEIFEAEIKGAEFLITETGALESSGKCLAVPNVLLDVWSPSQVSAGFSSHNLPILSRHISDDNQKKLRKKGHVKNLNKVHVIETLMDKRLPRPRFWLHLLYLWDYISADVTAYRSKHDNMHVVPVRGKEILYAASEVIRPSEKRDIKSADWEFLTPYLLPLDLSWVQALQQWRNDDTNSDEFSGDQVHSALNVLQVLELDKATSINRIFSKVTDTFFQDPSPKIQDCVRLAHIAAKLEANVPGNFKFVKRDSKLRSTDSCPIVADIDGLLEKFVDKKWYRQNVLHEAYMQHSETCTNTEWRRWVRSTDSGLHSFVPLDQITSRIYSRYELTEDLRRRGFNGKPDFPYKRNVFRVTDWDFDSAHWEYWKLLAKDDDRFWATLMTFILEQPDSYWSDAASALVSQLANVYSCLVTQESLLPEWILRFRNLPCILDTCGKPHQPAEVFQLTPETKPLLDVKPFVREDLDTELTRPLLKLLGVRDNPTGPGQILERLQALARSKPLPLYVRKWCYSLDQLFDRCSTSDIQEIKTAFANDQLILTNQNEWANSDEVFLNSDIKGLQEAVLIHPLLQDLSLWRKIGVQERPTAEMEIEWLKGLPSGGKLNELQTRRVQQIMRAYPDRIWNETGHWLNLEGSWVPVGSLVYSLTPLSPSWNNLFQYVKERTADFQLLSFEICQNHPFLTLRTLAEAIEEKVQRQLDLPNSKEKSWLFALGTGLRRIVLDNSSQMERVRELAQRLSQTRWQVARGLKSVPYIDGTPVGTLRPNDVLWHKDLLYVREYSVAKLASLVPQEIAKPFKWKEITEAIKICYERDPIFIDEYLKDKFKLAPLVAEAELDSSSAPEVQSDTRKEQGTADLRRDGLPLGDVQVKESTMLTNEDNSDNKLSVSKIQRPSRPYRQSFIERFAQAHGFVLNETGNYGHTDGKSLRRTSGSTFQWELISAQGDILQYYWLKDHCIQREPLQLDVEIWHFCKDDPELYSLILTDVDDAPSLISGSQLVEMLEQKTLSLHPAKYRLKYNAESENTAVE